VQGFWLISAKSGIAGEDSGYAAFYFRGEIVI